MKSIAVVLAVDQYKNLSSLPGCANDGNAIRTILATEPKFSDPLVISGEARSADVKARLTDFISQL